MRRAGCFMLLIGIESAQDKTLGSMKKGFDTAKICDDFEVLRRSGMLVHAYFIVGAIGETEAEMREIGPFARPWLGVNYYGRAGIGEERREAASKA